MYIRKMHLSGLSFALRHIALLNDDAISQEDEEAAGVRKFVTVFARHRPNPNHPLFFSSPPFAPPSGTPLTAFPSLTFRLRPGYSM